jgi:hypothetical protein
VEIELRPEPDAEIAEAVAEAVARAVAEDGDPGAWWREGLEENLEQDLP